MFICPGVSNDDDILYLTTRLGVYRMTTGYSGIYQTAVDKVSTLTSHDTPVTGIRCTAIRHLIHRLSLFDTPVLLEERLKVRCGGTPERFIKYVVSTLVFIYKVFFSKACGYVDKNNTPLKHTICA